MENGFLMGLMAVFRNKIRNWEVEIVEIGMSFSIRRLISTVVSVLQFTT
jgi:hypothetical protein